MRSWLRGLRTDKPKLVITDGVKVPIGAVEDGFPFLKRRLQRFHKLSNVAKRAPRKHQPKGGNLILHTSILTLTGHTHLN